MDISALKSGTDLRGIALGENTELTDEAVKAAVKAYVYWLKERSAGKKVALGHDSRLSAQRIAAAAEQALKESGCEIYFIGLCSTPSAFMMTKFSETDCDGAIMITASHHPFDRNGLKFFTKSGGIDSSDLDKIIEYAAADKSVAATESKIYRKDFMKLYCDFLVDKARTLGGCDMPLEGMKICVDAGGGAGGFFAERVLLPLGADIGCSQYLEPDGNFSGHIPNPENQTAMRALTDRVTEKNADLGIIFDADVDRAAVASSDGSEINRNRLIALISAILLSETGGATIVTDSVTSSGLTEFIAAKGGIHRRFKRGYRNVIGEAQRLEKLGTYVPLAIETSGHAALKENYYLDDGAYLSLRLAVKAAQLKREGKKLTDLISDLKQAVESTEVRLKVLSKDFRLMAAQILSQLESVCKELENGGMCNLAKDSAEGVRAEMSFANGFFLARVSVHDPVVVINIESNEFGGVKKIAGFLQAFFGSYSLLDCSALKQLA
jgi:phosphomannomutase